ncbi:hypothetical protein B0H16DRAFT_1560413 [Mycena metata]|uniref:Uncharacterized protein n=1 Tax=Mycena metata TaxID=1033252 RepID=A0AAD7ILS2_9AGAR|nr:hypothetical protein B0H16DRAFT_1560413 [Mycena metata]
MGVSRVVASRRRGAYFLFQVLTRCRVAVCSPSISFFMFTPLSSLIFSLLHPHILSSHGRSHFGRTHCPHPPPRPISTPSWPILGYLFNLPLTHCQQILSGSNHVAEARAVVNQFRARCMRTSHLSLNSPPPNDTHCASLLVTHEGVPVRAKPPSTSDPQCYSLTLTASSNFPPSSTQTHAASAFKPNAEPTHGTNKRKLDSTQQQDRFILSIFVWFHLEGALFKLNVAAFPAVISSCSAKFTLQDLKHSKASPASRQKSIRRLNLNSACSRSCKVSFNFNFAT